MIELVQIFAATEGGGEKAAEEATGGIGALGLDPLAILAQAVTFLVLFWVVKKFALEKIVNTLEERRKTIDKGVHLGIEMQAEKDKLEEQVAQVLQATRVEADGIIAAGHTRAGEIIKQAENTAARKMDTMLTEARAKIEEDTVRSRALLKQETLKLVARATEAIIEEKLDAQKDASLIQRMLKKVGAA